MGTSDRLLRGGDTRLSAEDGRPIFILQRSKGSEPEREACRRGWNFEFLRGLKLMKLAEICLGDHAFTDPLFWGGTPSGCTSMPNPLVPEEKLGRFHDSQKCLSPLKFRKSLKLIFSLFHEHPPPKISPSFHASRTALLTCNGQSQH